MQPLTEQGSDGFANGICLLVKEAMVRGRSSALRAEPYQRSEGRLSHANGYKDKSLSTRVGRITFDVPQVRGGLEFYPSTLDKGIRMKTPFSRPCRVVVQRAICSRYPIAECVLKLLTVVKIALRVANAGHPKAPANAALPHA